MPITSVITPTRTPAGPSPTKKPVTPTATVAKGSPTPNVPPGLYATKVDTIPAKPAIGNQLGFKVTFFNNTGATQTYTWMVKVFQCPEQCTGDTAFKHSYGETLRTSANIGTGAVELSTSQTINLGTGIRCDLVAIPYYVNPVDQQVLPFRTPDGGNALYQAIKLCQ